MDIQNLTQGKTKKVIAHVLFAREVRWLLLQWLPQWLLTSLDVNLDASRSNYSCLHPLELQTSSSHQMKMSKDHIRDS